MQLSEHTPTTWPATIDRSGRVLLPAELRRTIGVQPGVPMTWVKENYGIVLRTFDDVIADIQAYFTSLPRDTDELASDQLIRERREEAAREDAELDGIERE